MWNYDHDFDLENNIEKKKKNIKQHAKKVYLWMYITTAIILTRIRGVMPLGCLSGWFGELILL